MPAIRSRATPDGFVGVFHSLFDRHPGGARHRRDFCFAAHLPGFVNELHRSHETDGPKISMDLRFSDGPEEFRDVPLLPWLARSWPNAVFKIEQACSAAFPAWNVNLTQIAFRMEKRQRQKAAFHNTAALAAKYAVSFEK